MGRAWPGQHPRRLLRFDPGAYRRDGEGGRGAGAAAYPRRAGPHAARRARTLHHGGRLLMDEGPTWTIREAGESDAPRSEEHTSELQSLMRISYAVFCLKKKKQYNNSQKN